MPAPSTRRAQRHHGPLFGTTSINRDDFLPSLSLLRSAKASGTIATEPDQVLRFLTAYVDLRGDASPFRVERLCGEHKMPLSTLHQIAITLLRSTRPPHHALAKHILLTSSKLGIPEATYFLISEGLRRDRLSQAQLQPALQHLSRLASTGADFRALVLWGQVLVSRRQEQRAMKVLQKVIDKDQITSPNRKDEDEEPESRSPFRISKGTAYTLLASHHLKSKNISLARSLSKFAAEKYDDLEAWLSLAQTQPPASPERERYLTHAATKGSLEAADQLGEYFLEKWRGKRNSQDRMWAREWLSLGLQEGIPRGQAELKKLLA